MTKSPRKRRGGLTEAQRARFFGEWWPKCCDVQGWDDKSEKLRREFVLEATTNLFRQVPDMPPPTNRLSLCTQKQLTAVFQLCWHKSDPNSLNAVMPVANPVEAAEADEQRKTAFALREKLPEHEIAQIAASLCRKHHVRHWEQLPSAVLKNMAHWKQFQPAEIQRRRQQPQVMPLATTTGDRPFEYILRPAPATPKACVPGPF